MTVTWVWVVGSGLAHWWSVDLGSRVGAVGLELLGFGPWAVYFFIYTHRYLVPDRVVNTLPITDPTFIVSGIWYPTYIIYFFHNFGDRIFPTILLHNWSTKSVKYTFKTVLLSLLKLLIMITLVSSNIPIPPLSFF